mgnify:CR=1 FL=1
MFPLRGSSQGGKVSRSRWFFHSLVVILVVLDQLIKALVVKNIFLYQKVEVIPGFANLTRVHNRGVIFGAFSNLQHPFGRLLLTLVSFIALAVVIIYYLKTPVTERVFKFSFALILAGAVGNLLDRFFRGYVVDFIDLYVGRHHWPFFNLADSCITIGGLLLIIYLVLPSRRKACFPSS